MDTCWEFKVVCQAQANHDITVLVITQHSAGPEFAWADVSAFPLVPSVSPRSSYRNPRPMLWCLEKWSSLLELYEVRPGGKDLRASAIRDRVEVSMKHNSVLGQHFNRLKQEEQRVVVRYPRFNCA